MHCNRCKLMLLVILMLSSVILFSACGTEKIPEITLPSVGDTTKENPADSIAAFDTPETGSARMTIVWDNFTPKANQMMKLPDDCKIAAALNEQFDVTMSSQLMTDWNWTEVLEKQREEGKLPDIFTPYFNKSYKEVFETGGMRTIPTEMIERYAPRYAEFLRNAGEDAFDWYKTDDGMYFALISFEQNTDMLATYSVYRLDWLEEIGVTPHGDVSEIEDRLFFTESAFTMDEFVDIMKRFTDADKDRYGLSDGAEYYHGTDTLMGMFGVNWSIMRENGRAIPAVASDGFRSFLLFIESLNEMGVIKVGDDSWNDRYNNKVGWWNDNIRNIFGDSGYAQGLLAYNPDMKLLITPPEIGPSGQQGVDTYYGMGSMIISNVYMISADVPDEKLTKILEIFDGVSFDPELYVMTKYGFEGEDFTWIGEPYQSPARINRDSDEYTGLFNTRTIDGNAGKLIYSLPSEAMYRYATSAEARVMNLPPYKSDPNNEYADELAALQEKYESMSDNFNAEEYYRDILFGIKQVDYSWDEHIAALEAAGLSELVALLEKFPVTND